MAFIMRASVFVNLCLFATAGLIHLSTGTPVEARDYVLKRAAPISPKVVIISMFAPEAAVWYGKKYNLLVHFLTVHPTADHNQHKELYTIGMEERAHLKTLYHTKPRHSKKKKQVMNIKISEAHSTRHALR